MSTGFVPSARTFACNTDRPARAGVLLSGLGKLVRPDFPRRPARLDRGLLVFGITLPGGGHDACVHDLPQTRDEPGDVDRPAEPLEEIVQGARPDQRLAKAPERVRVRHYIGDPKPTEPHPAQPITDHASVPRDIDPLDRGLSRATLQAQPVQAL